MANVYFKTTGGYLGKQFGGYQYTWDFSTNEYRASYEFMRDGSITFITKANVSNYQIKLNGSDSSIPFTFGRGDRLKIDVSKNVDNRDEGTRITLANNFFNQENINLKTIPYIDKSRRHLFILLNQEGNGANQYVLIIDTSTDTIDSSVLLPSYATVGNNIYYWCTLWYDNYKDRVYVISRTRLTHIDANPDSSYFGLIVDSAGDPSATYAYAGGTGTGYSWYNGIWNPYAKKVILSQEAYQFSIEYDPYVVASQNYTNRPTKIDAHYGNSMNGYILPNGNLLTRAGLGSGMAELRRMHNYPYNQPIATSEKNWVIREMIYSGGTPHANGTAMYFPKYDKYFAGAGTFETLYPEDFYRKTYIGAKHANGTSTYYQSSNRGAYSPDFDVVLTTSYWRQNTAGNYDYFYLIDIPGEVKYDTRLIPDLSTYTGVIYMPMVTYSHYSRKFYALVTGGTTNYYQGRLYIYDISTWIDNGKTDLNDVSIGQIDLTAYRSNPHSSHFDYCFMVQCGNWLDIIE